MGFVPCIFNFYSNFMVILVAFCYAFIYQPLRLFHREKQDKNLTNK